MHKTGFVITTDGLEMSSHSRTGSFPTSREELLRLACTCCSAPRQKFVCNDLSQYPKGKNTMKTNVPTSVRALITAASVGLLLSSPVQSDDYDFIQVNAVQAEYAAHPMFTFRGVELRASKGWRNFFTELRYRDLTDDSQGLDMEEKRWNASLGYAIPISERTRVDVRANFGDVELTLSKSQRTLQQSSDYSGVSTFIHHAVSARVDLFAGLEYQSWDKDFDQKAYHLGSNYRFDRLTLGAEYTKYSDSDAINLVLRYSF